MIPEKPELAPLRSGDDNAGLREKIDQLEREVQCLRQNHTVPHIVVPETSNPKPRTSLLRGLALALAAVLVLGFAAGFLPKLHRQHVLAAETEQSVTARPVVPAAVVTRAPAETVLVLPGTLQAITEAPVLSRADGYVKRRYSDIGDRVAQGQLLAEIEAPELEQQVKQAASSLEQGRSTLEQTKASLSQGVANRELARVSAARYGNLEKRGVVSRQENDTYQARYQADAAAVDALQKGVSAAQNSVSASEANLARLKQIFSYLKVRAPFAGIITLRNVDQGTLVAAGNTMLFRVAQTGTLRTLINAPQVNASEMRVGQSAQIAFNELPGRVFEGKVARSSGALDPATRTLLVEVQVANPKGELLPGMYANVTLHASREDPPMLIPSEALIARAEGTLVAVVDQSNIVHFRPVRVGRDTGSEIEVLSGIQEGMKVVVNPNDSVREGVAVEARPFLRPHIASPAAGSPAAGRKSR
jgi:RND family efflux transporter MFP subunit